MKIVAIIPAYNEEKTLSDVLKQVKPHVNEIIVVNDGSSDKTESIANKAGVHVYTHVINRGLGAALGTGFAAAIKHKADIAITLDADGQHDPKELPKFVDAIKDGAEVVIGTRMKDRTGMPWYRQIAQVIGNLVTYILFGAWVSDSQSGYRAFTKKALKAIDIRTNRMEVSSEIIAEIKHNNLVLAEVPIKAIYTDYSLSKGQGFFVGIKTLIQLIWRRLI